jgi:hypothetical protein
MRKFNYVSLIIILVFLVLNPYNIFPKEKNKNDRKSGLNKTATNPASSVVDINNITSWVGADGFHDWVVASSWNGAFPKGSNIGTIYAEGIVWGGQVHDGQTPLVRVNGNTYATGCSPITRLFRVRPDYQTGSLNDDAANFFSKSLGSVSQGDIDAVKQQYETDWKEWPGNEGAPYEDVNGNGVYDPDPNGNGIVGEVGEDIPGIPGAAQSLYIKYNDNLSATNYGSRPIGLEVRETYWAYAYTGALGNVIYKKVDIVYKGVPGVSASNSTIDSMYIVQWADPDVGTSSDDYAGCDTALNLGYAYTSKAEDATYQTAGFKAPAVGYDFLQGVSQYTGNPSDSAIYNLKWRKGYKYVNPKPMSSFIYFAAGGNWIDPSFDYTGTLEFYNLMRGVKPEPMYPSADPFPDAVLDVTPFGKYLLDGDPVAGTGKIDGNSAAGGDGPGDRRIMVVNGPISMKLGDTAQVVLALVGALGVSDPGNLSSITELKTNDRTAQIVFDQLFQLPTLPPPDVHVDQLSNKLVLDWGVNADIVNKIENFSSQGYKFEGYDVYQLPTPSAKLTEGTKLGTFDLINGIKTIVDTVQQSGILLPVITEEGQDKGVQHYLVVTKDPFRGGQPLRNGQEYYFAVVPYAFNPAPLLPFHALQSSVVIKVGVPQEPTPGNRYSSAIGDTIKGLTHEGPSDGSAVALVIDPSLTTGDTYNITFANNSTWSVTDVTKNNTVIASNITNQSGGEAYPIVDGILIKVFGPEPDFKDFQEVANANGPHDPTYASFTFNGSGFPSSFPADVDRPTPDPAGARWGFQSGNTDGSFNYAWFKSRVLRAQNNFGANLIPYDYEIRFTPGKGHMYFTTDNLVDVPFQIWNIGAGTPNDPSDDFQMCPRINDVNEDDKFGLDSVDHGISGGDNDPETDWMYIYEPAVKTPGSAGYNSWVADPTVIGNEVMARLVLVNYNGGSISDPTFPANMNEQLPAPGTVYRIISTKPNTVNDVFTFTAPKNTVNDPNLSKVDVNKINVFPNPYYGFQYRETSRDAKYVTFSHLPPKATIRIFDLSGVLVKTVNKNDPTQFTTWNLQNNDNYPVASGIYVVYIDMPELGSTKVLKLAVVQEEQILKVY